MENSKNELYIMAIVAIVAVVSLAVIVINGGSKAPSNGISANSLGSAYSEDNSGMARAVAREPEVILIGDGNGGSVKACCCTYVSGTDSNGWKTGTCTDSYSNSCCS